MHTVTVKIDEDLKRKMSMVKINWSEYIRDAIQRRVEWERRSATENLLKKLKGKRPSVPKGFIDETVREMREAR